MKPIPRRNISATLGEMKKEAINSGIGRSKERVLTRSELQELFLKADGDFVRLRINGQMMIFDISVIEILDLKVYKVQLKRRS
jgi:hypothetical protein